MLPTLMHINYVLIFFPIYSINIRRRKKNGNEQKLTEKEKKQLFFPLFELNYQFIPYLQKKNKNLFLKLNLLVFLKT